MRHYGYIIPTASLFHVTRSTDGQWLILDSYCATFKLLCHVVRMSVLMSSSHIANDTWPEAHYRGALCCRVVTSLLLRSGKSFTVEVVLKVISVGTPVIRHIHFKNAKKNIFQNVAALLGHASNTITSISPWRLISNPRLTLRESRGRRLVEGGGKCCIGWCFFISGTYSHMTEVRGN